MLAVYHLEASCAFFRVMQTPVRIEVEHHQEHNQASARGPTPSPHP